MSIDIGKAILSLGEYEFVINDEINSEDDWNKKVQFISGTDENGGAVFLQTKPITYAEVLAEQQRLQTEYNNNQYQRDRASAYPSIQDQLDMQYWDSVNNTTTWKDTVAQVKADHPKN